MGYCEFCAKYVEWFEKAVKIGTYAGEKIIHEKCLEAYLKAHKPNGD